MIYCSFYCIYVWLDPGTYMIARFMFFYKPGVTAVAERIPKGKGDGLVAPSLGGTGAALGGAVTSSTTAPGCDMPASTHVGELRRAALCRSWPWARIVFQFYTLQRLQIFTHKSWATLVVCNTRFMKGHKPNSHIRARIKSHVYTIEWTVYHSTYHVKRYNKASTNVIYYINDKNVWYSGSEVQNTIKTLQS